MINNIMITFIKTFFMNLCIQYSFVKIQGIKNVKNAFIILCNIIISLGYALLYENYAELLQTVYLNITCYVLYLSLVALWLDKINKNYLIAMVISISFSFMVFFFSGTIFYFIIRVRMLPEFENSIVEYFVIGCIQIVLIYLFFKIKRFKDGFSFIKEESKIKNYITIIGIAFIIIALIFTTKRDRLIGRITSLAIVFVPVLFVYAIKQAITLHYKSKMKDKTVEMLKDQISEKDKIIEELRAELEATLKINHKYNHRISAAEKAIAKLKFSEELAEEDTEIIDLVNNLSRNYKEELSSIGMQKSETGIYVIDNMLEYMEHKASKDSISFETEVNTNIKSLTENIINISKLETLLADHINNAIIAIKYSKNENHKIKVVFDNIENTYEIKIYDTGIEFEINTLLKLGKEQITTHKDTGRKWNRIYNNI